MNIFLAYDEEGRIHAVTLMRLANSGVHSKSESGIYVKALNSSDLQDGDTRNIDSRFLFDLHANFRVDDVLGQSKLTHHSSGTSYSLVSVPAPGEVATRASFSGSIGVAEAAYGTLSPGSAVDIFRWGSPESPYNPHTNWITLWDVAPDPMVYTPGDPNPITFYGANDVQIARTWSTTWATSGGPDQFVRQRNVTVMNGNLHAVAYHLIACDIIA